MEVKKRELPILVHAYVPRIVKVGPVFGPEPTPWLVLNKHVQHG